MSRKNDINPRRYGKTLLVQQAVKEAIERGQKVYLPTSPPLAEDASVGQSTLEEE